MLYSHSIVTAKGVLLSALLLFLFFIYFLHFSFSFKCLIAMQIQMTPFHWTAQPVILCCYTEDVTMGDAQ